MISDRPPPTVQGSNSVVWVNFTLSEGHSLSGL